MLGDFKSFAKHQFSITIHTSHHIRWFKWYTTSTYSKYPTHLYHQLLLLLQHAVQGSYSNQQTTTTDKPIKITAMTIW